MGIDFTTNEGKLLLIFGCCALIYFIFKFLSRGCNEEPKHEKTKTEKLKQKTIEKRWTTSGWYYDEEKEKWISPDYTNSKANTKVPKFRTPEELEQAKLIKVDRSRPTYEEWKAARLLEQQGKSED